VNKPINLKRAALRRPFLTPQKRTSVLVLELCPENCQITVRGMPAYDISLSARRCALNACLRATTFHRVLQEEK
jgi:hypothetical protein